MAVTQLTCPECNATLRLKQEVPDGKRVRCRKCEAVFLPNQGRGEDNDLLPEPVRRRVSARNDELLPDRPRTGKKKRAKQKKTNPALIIVPIAIAVVLLLGGTATAVYYFWNSDEKPIAGRASDKVVAANSPVGKGKAEVNPNAAPAGAGGLNVGDAAMEIDGEDIDGKPFKLSDYRGKVVVLDFWGNW
jgi:predicted Zn finger-like uncharacterized protein